jgi:hypothetical protein
MKRRLLICPILLVLIVPAVASARPATPDEARAVGERFIEYMVDRTGGWGLAEEARIVDLNEMRRQDRLLGYHLSVYPHGHIVVSILKDLPPVKSFSYTCDFETASEEGYWQLLKDTMEETLKFIEKHYGPPDALGPMAEIAPPSNKEAWEWLAGSAAPPAVLATVGPLLKTEWGQGTPYNYFCPTGDGGRCVAGCVATAAAQVMRYWKHPTSGTGTHSYYWNGDQSCGGTTSGRTLQADFTDSYDWLNIKKRYIPGTYDSVKAWAVGELCYEVGVAFDMDYGYCGSGSYTYRGVNVYPTYFKYLDTVVRKNRSSYADADAWFARIKQEFDATPARVIHYRIHGHSIVCDGYMENGTNYIHLNYGWTGSSDDWYAVDNLYCPWEGCDPMVEYMLVGIQPGADFTDATSGPLGDGGSGPGVAWGDYDNDGDVDLYIVNDGSQNKLLRNDGGCVFTDVSGPPTGNTGSGQAAVWGDYDNDGDLDLYLSNALQQNRLFRNDDSVFVDVTAPLLADAGDGRGVAWGDYNNDGNLDLYLVNRGSSNKLFQNTGGGVFADATLPPLDDTGNGEAAAWADYDNDGDLDLCLINDGANRLLRNDDSIFVDVTSGSLGDTGAGRGVAWGDYDNDGDLDLYVTNRGTVNLLLRNDGSDTFVDVTSGPLADTGNGMGTAAADYDHDGDLDLYVANDGTANIIIRNDGGLTFKNVTVDPLGDEGAGAGVAWADCDADGDLDLYLVNDSEPNRLFRNDYHLTNHWLQVSLVGTFSNAAGIGARVRVVAGGVSQIREIASGSGYCSQNSLMAEFGLGESTVADTIEITWPSGIVQDTTTLAADQVVTVTEHYDVSSVRKVTTGPSALRLHPNRPNPFSPSTSIRYDLPKSAAVHIAVFDVRGRVVRVLVDSERREAGSYTVTWDGQTDGGQRAASGIYFCRLDAGYSAETRRMVLLE